MKLISTRGRILNAALFVVVALASSSLAQPLPELAVPPAIQQLRRHMLDANVNTLTFHSMDKIFYTRVVGRSGRVWELPRRDVPLDFSYEFEGQKISSEAFLERTFTNALLVMKDGVIVSEIYRNLTNQDTHFMSWSMAKSITGMLVGAAVADGRVRSLDDKIATYLPELAGGAYRDVTIRQVMEMRSGVDYEERYDFANPGIAARNHDNALVKNIVRFADAARDIKRKHEPGAVFEYKTIDTAVLGWLVERVVGTTVASYMTQKIWEPLGAEANGFFIMDGPPGVGREFTGAGFNATLRDYGRFGQMILNGGVANGSRLFSEGWVREATAPARGQEGPLGGYGYQWWTVANTPAFMALGLQGQYIYVDPATRTVVVKLSYFPPASEKVYPETLEFMKAASAWTPRATGSR